MAMLALFLHLAVAVAAGESPSLKKGLCIPPGEASILYISIYRYTGEASDQEIYVTLVSDNVWKQRAVAVSIFLIYHNISSLISELISTFVYWDISKLIIYLPKNFHCGDLEAFSRASWCSHNDNFTNRRICVFAHLCICVFVYLRICVFEYLCMCVFV